MNSNKLNDLQDQPDASEKVARLPDNYIPSHKYPGQNLKRNWVQSHAPKRIKVNRKLGQDTSFQSQQTLRDIMIPTLDTATDSLPESGQTISRNKADRGNAIKSLPLLQRFDKARHLSQDKDTMENPKGLQELRLEQDKQPEAISQDNALQETGHPLLKRLTHEIMEYEKNVAGLYEMIEEMGKENEKLRQRYMLMCESVVAAAWQQTRQKNLIETVEGSTDEETCTSDDSDEDFDAMPLGKFSHLKEELGSLEGRILQKLHELKESQKSVGVGSLRCGPTIVKRASEGTLCVKELKNKLDRSERELKEVRKFAEVRVANLKVSLSSESALRAKIKMAHDESKEYVKKAAAHLKHVNESIKQYQAVNDTQEKLIHSLHKRLADAELKVRNENTQSVEVSDVSAEKIKQSKNYDALLEKYNRISTAYAVLNSVSNTQNNDLAILDQQYEEERLKSVSLMCVVEQQRKNFKLIRNEAISCESVAMKRLSKMYDDLCDQRSKEAKENEEKTKHIHDMYKKLLKKKDEEHHSAIENIAQELAEFRGLNKPDRSEKHEEQNQTSAHVEHDIDKNLSSVEPDNTLIRITE